MTTYFQTSNQPYLVLSGNGGILLSSDNIASKNRDQIVPDRVYAAVNEALARVSTALKSINK